MEYIIKQNNEISIINGQNDIKRNEFNTIQNNEFNSIINKKNDMEYIIYSEYQEKKIILNESLIKNSVYIIDNAQTSIIFYINVKCKSIITFHNEEKGSYQYITFRNLPEVPFEEYIKFKFLKEFYFEIDIKRSKENEFNYLFLFFLNDKKIKNDIKKGQK